ncbi:MAG: translocation/assembly module TamB domain-containing protein, partial [Candidatus Adiutrix sp.]|nr:translocation/assembly module TamB domain-containing protein [Candidatus Adiutrix sp.]
ELEPASLLAGLVHLPRVRLAGPTLVLSPPDERADSREEDLFLPGWLRRLRLDELALTRGRLERRGHFDLENLDVQAAGLAWRQGGFNLKSLEIITSAVSLSGRGAWKPGPGGGEISLDLEARLDDLARWLPDWSGPLEAGIRGGGRPSEFLAAQVEARSPGLTSPQGAWSGLVLSGEVNSELSGRLAFQAESGPGGPLDLKADWRFLPPDDRALPESAEESSRGTLALENLKIQAPGLALAGNLDINFTGGAPGLRGRLMGRDPDWDMLAARSGLELRGGPASLTLDLAMAEGQKGDLLVELAHLALGPASNPELTLSETTISLSADDIFGRRDLDLGLDLGPGRAAGLAWARGELKAEARDGRGSWSLAAGGDFDLAAGGEFDMGRAKAEVARLELKAGPTGLKLAAPVGVSWAEGLKISPVKAGVLPAGELTLSAKLGPEELGLKAEIKKLPCRFLDFFVQAGLPEGQVQSLALDLERKGRAWSGNFSLKTSLSPGVLGRLTPELDLAGRLERRGRFNEDQALTAQGTLSGGPGWPASGKIDLSLPLAPGLDGAPPRPDFQGPLAGRLDFSGPLEPLWSLANFPDRVLTGQAHVGLDLAGSLSRPDLAGSLKITGGRYEDRVLGLWLRDLDLSAEGRPDQAFQVTLAGRDLGRGELRLAGEIRGPAGPSLKAEGFLKSFKPLRRDDLSLTLSGTLALAGPLDDLTVSSDLTLEDGELDLNLFSGSSAIATLPLSEPGQAEAVPAKSALRLDLKLNAPGRFNITGYGLESEWRGWLRVAGPPGRHLALTGELRPVRGWYEPPVFNRQFSFDRGQVTFTGDPIPFLDLELANQSPELTAIIKIEGPARQPRITLTSRPPLSQDEVAGRLLFGKSPSSISRLETLQLAAVLRDLTNFGGDSLNPLKTVRRTLGLDVLRLGGSSGPNERQVSELSGSLAGDLNTPRAGERPENEAVSIEAGKYINDNIYMGVEHSGSGPAVRLEVELAPSISLEARSSPESSQVGLGWKKDY